MARQIVRPPAPESKKPIAWLSTSRSYAAARWGRKKRDHRPVGQAFNLARGDAAPTPGQGQLCLQPGPGAALAAGYGGGRLGMRPAMSCPMSWASAMVTPPVPFTFAFLAQASGSTDPVGFQSAPHRAPDGVTSLISLGVGTDELEIAQQSLSHHRHPEFTETGVTVRVSGDAGSDH